VQTGERFGLDHLGTDALGMSNPTWSVWPQPARVRAGAAADAQFWHSLLRQSLLNGLLARM
jgi:ATP-dependent DNA helicase RecQ